MAIKPIAARKFGLGIIGGLGQAVGLAIGSVVIGVLTAWWVSQDASGGQPTMTRLDWVVASLGVAFAALGIVFIAAVVAARVATTWRSIRSKWNNPTESKPLPLAEAARSLTTYEIERKLTAIDAALAFLRDELEVLAEARNVLVDSKAKMAVTDPGFHTTYQGDVANYLNAVIGLDERLVRLKRELAPYPDVALKLDRNYRELREALARYVRVIFVLAQSIKSNADEADLFELMSIEAAPVMKHVETMLNKRAGIEKQLVDMRRVLSP